MNHFSILVLLFTFTSTHAADSRTVDLNELLATPDPVRLPQVFPNSNGPIAAGESISKPESFFDKLTAPLSLLTGAFPCLGQTSLKAGKCMSFNACAADGGFGDGKGLCIGDVVCCVKPIKCGEFSLLNNTVLANPGFPSATNQVGKCGVKLVKPFGISHIKLLIEDMELAQPNAETGRCDVDSFSVVGGILPTFKLGKICGLNTKTHLYIPTVIELTDIFINIELADNGALARRWLIRVEMIDAKSPEKPPTGCTQYFRESSGLLTSLNFDLANNTGLGNIDDLDYGICIDAPTGCQVEFTDLFFDLGGRVKSHDSALSTLSNNKFSRGSEIAPARQPPTYKLNYGGFRPALKYKPSNRFNGLLRPAYRPAYRPSYQPSSQSRPVYHLPALTTAQKYPFSQFLYKLPYSSIVPTIGGARPWAVHPNGYFGAYNAPMQSSVEGLTDFKIQTLGGESDKLDKLESLIAGNSPQGICQDQDILILPTPADFTSSVHCGNDLHFGQKFVSAPSRLTPFMIEVKNTGKVHGKGFALKYNMLC